MFHQDMNVFGILTFAKKDYKEIVDTIIASRGYVSYIDSKKNSPVINRRYENYVMLKQAAYTSNPPKLDKNPNTNKIYTVIRPAQINNTQIDEFLEGHGIQDDFEYNYNVQYQDSLTYMVTHEVIPIEYDVYNKALNIDDLLEELDYAFLDEDFLFKNVQRFTLPPFLAKFDGKYVKPFIIANVYDVGVITIQISLSFDKDSVGALNSTAPNLVNLEELQFYQLKTNYSSRDYWTKEKMTEGTVYDVLDYYKNFLTNICSNLSLQKEKEHQIAWVFGDFEVNKRPNHVDFINKNKRFYVSYLLNSRKDVIERMTKEEIDERLTNYSVNKYKNIHFYCSEFISLLTFSYSAFHEEAVKLLKDQEKELKKEKLYESSLQEIYKELLLYTKFQFLRYYELTFIKKYFSLKLLYNLSNNQFKTIADYNVVRKEFNSLKINYDEEILFKSYGSPRTLYSKLLLKSGTNSILNKVETMLANAREDINSMREHNINKSETYILIMTSILTVLLGYRGIKYIVYDFLANLPYNIGTFFAEHPLRWTVTFWLVLCIVMVILNIFRYKANK